MRKIKIKLNRYILIQLNAVIKQTPMINIDIDIKKTIIKYIWHAYRLRRFVGVCIFECISLGLYIHLND
jgi:hypothetical protein